MYPACGSVFLDEAPCAPLSGIKPKRFTTEWMLANKERERAENSNPMTRYLDRRRKVRSGCGHSIYIQPMMKLCLFLRGRERAAFALLPQTSCADAFSGKGLQLAPREVLNDTSLPVSQGGAGCMSS